MGAQHREGLRDVVKLTSAMHHDVTLWVSRRTVKMGYCAPCLCERQRDALPCVCLVCLLGVVAQGMGMSKSDSSSRLYHGSPYLSKLESISSSAVRAADKVGASLIVVYTHTGVGYGGREGTGGSTGRHSLDAASMGLHVYLC